MATTTEVIEAQLALMLKQIESGGVKGWRTAEDGADHFNGDDHFKMLEGLTRYEANSESRTPANPKTVWFGA